MSRKTVQSSSILYGADRPLEDVDSRTIFMRRQGNEKDQLIWSLCVRKRQIMLLSLDGTSFMSRILEVVKRSCAHQESTPVMTWHRIARGSQFADVRFARVPFSKGIPGAFRPRLPIKPGARSLRWKRDAQTTPADAGASVTGNNFSSPTARNLTYVRTEPKSEWNANRS